MKASELRIGNLVYNSYTGKNVNVTMDILMSIEVHGTESIYKPLHLLKGWLTILEFEETKLPNDRSKFTKWKIDLVEDEPRIFTFSQGKIYMDIIYIHQLQNLYFALTGEELQTI